MAQVEIPAYKRVEEHQEKKRTKKTERTPLRFKKSDYIFGALAFLAARASMLGQMSPFAVSLFGAVYSKTRMPLTMLFAMIGYLSTGMGVKALKYLIAMAVFYAYRAIFVKNGREDKAFVRAAVIGGGLFAGGMAVMMFDMVLAYNVVLLALESLICAFLTIVLKEAGTFADMREKSKGPVGNEQLLSLLIIFGISLAGMRDITKIGSVSLSEIVCVTAVIFVAYCRGMAMGACAGACAGLICAMNSADMLPVIGIFTLCGFASGCVRTLGKNICALTFAVCAASMGFMTTAYIYGNVGIVNFLLGSAVFMICPKSKADKIAAFADGYYGSYSEVPYMQRMQELMQSRLGEISSTFNTLAHSFDELSQRRAQQDVSPVARIFDDTAKKICGNCGLCAHCWEKETAMMYKMVNAVEKKLDEKGYADILDVPEEFREKCVHAPEFIAAANHFFEINRINSLWEGQMEESRKVLSQQYRGFASVVGALSDELSGDILYENKYEKKIISELKKKQIFLKSICVFEKSDESFEVEAEFYEKEESEKIGEICEVISQVLKHPMRVTDTPSDELRVIFEPLLNYKIVSGVAVLKKDGQQKCGDSYCALSLNDNRYALAISDGMGSGENAACESSVTINLLKKLLLAGFDKTAAVQLINSALVLKSGTEAFATIDLAVIDLINAQADFVKIGAAAGYIKREDKIESMYCSTLPAGILTEADIQFARKRLCGGDYIVLVSDGVANAKKNTNWIGEVLGGINADEDPDTVAEIILKEAVINKRGAVDDDMTVIAAKILDK